MLRDAAMARRRSNRESGGGDGGDGGKEGMVEGTLSEAGWAESVWIVGEARGDDRNWRRVW